MSMSQEIEIRFAAPERELKRIARSSALHGFKLGPAATHNLRTVYFDTADLALCKAGYALRVRQNGKGFVQTVKEASSGALASERNEYECEVPTAEVDLSRVADEDLRLRLEAAVNGSPIEPVLETEIRRTTRAIKSPLGDEIELAVDQGEIRTLTNGHAALPVSELEIELKSGERLALYDVARRLSRKAPLTVAVESKAERGFRAIEGQALSAHKAGRIGLTPE